MNVDELLWDPWEVIWGSQEAGRGLDFEPLRAEGLFCKSQSIAEARQSLHCLWVLGYHFSGCAIGGIPAQLLVPSPGLLYEDTQGIINLKNKINTPLLWDYFPIGSVSLLVWGYGCGVRMRHGVRDPCWQKLLCCSWWNTDFLLHLSKPCDLTKSRNWAGSNQMSLQFFGWHNFNLDPVLHHVASWGLHCQRRGWIMSGGQHPGAERGQECCLS